MRDTGFFVLGGAVAHSREDGSLHFVSTVQSFGKSGWSRALRAYIQKESPGSNRRKDAASMRQPACTQSGSAMFPAWSIWCATLL